MLPQGSQVEIPIFSSLYQILTDTIDFVVKFASKVRRVQSSNSVKVGACRLRYPAKVLPRGFVYVCCITAEKEPSVDTWILRAVNEPICVSLSAMGYGMLSFESDVALDMKFRCCNQAERM